MKSKMLTYTVLGLLFAAHSAVAEETTRYELQGGTSASINSETTGGTFGRNGTSNAEIGLDGTYGFFLTSHWEPQLSLHARILTGDGASTIVTPMAGIVYNFSDDIVNAFYLGGRMGPSFRTYSSSGNSYILLSYAIFVGKRIRLADRISWAPEFSLGGHGSGSALDSNGREWQVGSYVQWALTPLQIALLF